METSARHQGTGHGVGATSSDDLVALMAAIARGDRAAFADVYRITSPRLMSVALNVMKARDAAEDVLQESYVTVWRSAGLYDPARGHPLAWMTTLVRRKAIDRLRAQQRQGQATESDTNALREISVTESLPGFGALGGVRVDLRKCLERLRTEQSSAILLAYHYGLTHEELARQMNTPLGTVKSWVRRGLADLKECLEQ